MQANFQILPIEIETAVAMQHGGPVAVPGQHDEHVAMTMAVFREMVGVGSDEAFEESVDALRRSLDHAAAGRVISLDEATQKLTQKYGA